MQHRTLTAAMFAALVLPLIAVAQTAPQQTGASGNIAFCNATDPSTSGSAPCAPGTSSAQAIGADSIAAGQATASGGDSMALGQFAYALDEGDIALGKSALAGTGSGTGGNVSIGDNSWAIGGQSVTVGNNAQGHGFGSVLIGAQGTDTLSSNSSLPPDPATGVYPGSTGNYVVALGYGSVAAGNYAVAINGQALMPSGVAIAGTAEQTGSVAIGGGAIAVTSYALAGGAYANAQGAYSVALGPWANAQGDYSVALGEGSQADRVETVSIGDDGSTGNTPFQRQLVNLAAGTQPFDAVNVSQLNAGGSALAAWIGGGAMFDAAGAGSFTAPTFVLTNPYTPGSYNSVSGAITALDSAITQVSKQPGPAGPQGATGATGATGPAGKDGANGAGAGGADALAVHYDSTKRTSVTLDPAGDPTTVRNVAMGVAPTDAANVAQIDEALKSAKTYTDTRSVDTLNQANAYTDLRVAGLNARINYALAAATANANAAAAVAAQDPTHRNRVAVSDGLASGVNAWTFMYQHVTNSGVTWNASLTGEQGGGSSSERQAGVGVGYSW